MADYKYDGDSQKEKSDRKRLTKVTKGKVVARNKSELSRLKDAFISGNGERDLKSDILYNVITPVVKRGIYEAIKNTIDTIFFGGRGGGGNFTHTVANSVAYSNFYGGNKTISSGSKSSFAYAHKDIVVESRTEAEDILERLCEAIETYGSASVADLYDLVGISSQYTDNKYGWTNLRNAEPVPVSGGYLLRMPKVLPLK